MAFSLIPKSGPGILVKEMWSEFEKGVDASRGPWVKQLYLLDDWTQTDAAINTLTGAGTLRPPFRCPTSSNLFCVSARAVGVGEVDDHSSSHPNFRRGEIEVTFAIPPYTPDGSNAPPQFVKDDGSGPYLFMEMSMDWDTEVYKLPDNSFTWLGDGKPVEIPGFASIAVAEFVVVRKFQSTLPYTNLQPYLNKLNQNPLFGQPKGQLQLRKVSTKTQAMSDATYAADISYTFKWREWDHNFLFKPDSGTFVPILNKSKQGMYQYADISQVLV